MIISSLAKLVWTTFLISLLNTPRRHHHPHPLLLMVEATGGRPEDAPIGIHGPKPGLKEWGLDTNFDNVDNWEGLRGYENCSGNIYSFQEYLDESVVTLPRVFIGKQIILPVNGHFVFQEGKSILSGQSSGQQTTCRGREVNFLRTYRADWFHPDNWIRRNEKDDEKKSTSLLNRRRVLSPGVAHVERVPCQYDSVRFPANSSFNLKISSNVSIAGFFLGNKKQTYTDVAILMNSKLGKLQFQKAPETIFSIRDNDGSTRSGDHTSSPHCHPDDADSDHCICSNYGREMKRKICSLVSCSEESVDNECANPIIPHGFCCPICGFHLKIRHSGSLRLNPLYTKLEAELKQAKLTDKVSGHLTRYQEKAAHLVVVPTTRNESEMGRIQSLILKFQSILNKESGVIEVTLTESWERLLPSGAQDRLEGSGLGGGLITLIVILLLVALLAGLALFIFIWNKKHGYPPLTFSSVSSVLNRMPSMSIPIVPGRRSSTLSGNLQSFGFARFTNERGSTVTISHEKGAQQQTTSGVGGESAPPKPGKSSSIRRAEQVDDEPLPVTVEVPETVTDAQSGAFGFSNVTYDLIGVGDGNEQNAPQTMPDPVSERKMDEQPVLQIPEVMVVDVDDSSATSGIMVPEKRKETTTTASANKEGGKFSKPSFVTSRMGMAYQKLTPEEEDSSPGETSSGKKKGKKEKGKGSSADSNTTKSGRLVDAHSKDQEDHHRQQQEQDVQATTGGSDREDLFGEGGEPSQKNKGSTEE